MFNINISMKTLALNGYCRVKLDMFIIHTTGIFKSSSCSFNYLVHWIVSDVTSFHRTGIPSVGWHTASSFSCDRPIHHPNPTHNSHSVALPRGVLDSQHSWLHPRQGVACYGRWLPHDSPHNLSPQLRSLHNMDGLDVWHPSWPWGGPKERRMNET